MEDELIDMEFKEEGDQVQNVIINENTYQDEEIYYYDFIGQNSMSSSLSNNSENPIERPRPSSYQEFHPQNPQSSAKKKDFDYLYRIEERETVENLLQRWNFAPAIPKFREEQIDLFTLKFLVDKDVVEKLFKDYPMSVWLKFYNKLLNWKKSSNHQTYNQGQSFSQTQNFNQNFNQQKTFSQNKTFSPSLPHKAPALTQPQPEPQIQPRIPEFQVQPRVENHQIEKFENEIEKFLRSSVIGMSIINYHNEHNTLEPKHQDQLIECVCHALLEKGKPVSTSDFIRFSSEIKQLFPNESQEFYFVPRTAAEQTRGKLYNRYNNRLKKYREKYGLQNLAKRMRMGESGDAFSNCTATTSAPNRIEGILQSTTTGVNILNYYRLHNKLEIHQQDSLVNLIIDYMVDQRKLVSASDFLEYAEEVKQLFPTEKREYYFLPRFENENGPPKGRLYTKYYNRVKKLRENNEFPKKNTNQKLIFAAKKLKTQPSPHSTLRPLKVEPDSENFSEMDLEFLRCDFPENCEEGEWIQNTQRWAMSAEQRLQYIKNLKLDKLEKILELWPAFTYKNGYELVNIDFNILYPGKEAILVENWNEMKEKLHNVIVSTNKNRAVRDLLVEYSTSSPNVQDLILLLGLHSVFFNYGRIKYYDEFQQPKMWKYTIADSQGAFFTFCNDEQNIQSTIELKKMHYANFQISMSPVILGVGSDFQTIDKFYVIYGDISYTFDVFIHSLDALFKMYKVFDLKYPSVCNDFYLFVQKLLYDIHLDTDPISCQIERLTSRLKTN